MEKITEAFHKGKIGIYKITNTKNGKVYIGSTTDFKQRINSHIKKLNENNHDNKELQKEWNIYQSKNFEYDILEFTERVSDLPCREKFYIDQYKEINGVYNKSNPMEEYIHRGKKEKRYRGNNIKGKEYKHTQIYIVNFLNDNFQELIKLMTQRINDRIYFNREKVDNWIIKNIDDEDIKNDERINGLILRFYNKNGFCVTTGLSYRREIKEVYGITCDTDDEIIITYETNKRIYTARKNNMKKRYNRSVN